MQRYKIKIEYDGTPFVGWQFQKNGSSIQEVLQNAIFNFSREKVIVTGAGRTDSGVHALAQVAHFDLKKKFKKKNFLPGINQHIGNKPVTVLKINKKEAKINWNSNADKIIAQIHGLNPNPGAWFEFEKERIKVWTAKKLLVNGRPGTVLEENLTVACKSDSIQILEIQREGKNKQLTQDFLLGKKISKNFLLT